MSADWTPIFVLPNIPLAAAIGCEIAALAPANDHRVVTIKRAQPAFKNFLRRFADNFGEKFEPSVLILRRDVPAIFRDVTALASFRDLIALSVITRNRALELQYPRGFRVLFGEAFAIYPWMLDRHYEDVVGNTPAIRGIHQLSKFKGQSSPAIFRTSLGVDDIDKPLLSALMTRWRRRYEAAAPFWEDIALMRSLNMAYQASLLPAGTDATFYDVGRIVSLWVSAFEILVHPGGKNGWVTPEKVFELIERTPWILPETGQPTHETGGKKKVKRSLASWLYQMLYGCSNDFLHGNPVERASLFLATSQRTIFEYAAPLYRIALTAFLPLSHLGKVPTTKEAQAIAAYIAGRSSFLEPQRTTEKALLTANRPPLSRAARRARVAAAL